MKPRAARRRVRGAAVAWPAVCLFAAGCSASVTFGMGHEPPASSSAGHVAAASPQARTRLSRPGISIAMPAGWQTFHLPAPQHAVAAAPSLTPPCPNSVFGGQAACQDAVSITDVPGTSPARALKQAANVRFSAMHSDIVATDELRHGALTVGGCPAYLTEWHVTWIKPPSTLEERIVVKTGSTQASPGLESVFIRFADTPGSHPQVSINGVVSSIQCPA